MLMLKKIAFTGSLVYPKLSRALRSWQEDSLHKLPWTSGTQIFPSPLV